MATNRPYDLDEAMHRRIMIAIEFRQPDHLLRKAIWESHVPKEMKLADDIDLVSVITVVLYPDPPPLDEEGTVSTISDPGSFGLTTTLGKNTV